MRDCAGAAAAAAATAAAADNDGDAPVLKHRVLQSRLALARLGRLAGRQQRDEHRAGPVSRRRSGGECAQQRRAVQKKDGFVRHYNE
jgi:hypothetical protein